MSFVVALDFLSTKLGNRWTISEEKDRHVGSFELNPVWSQTSPQCEAQNVAVKRDAAFQISYLDVRVNRQHGCYATNIVAGPSR